MRSVEDEARQAIEKAERALALEVAAAAPVRRVVQDLAAIGRRYGRPVVAWYGLRTGTWRAMVDGCVLVSGENPNRLRDAVQHELDAMGQRPPAAPPRSAPPARTTPRPPLLARDPKPDPWAERTIAGLPRHRSRRSGGHLLRTLFTGGRSAAAA
ncbi:hypothetical protein amrb99_98340 [Actinomadura sp. RB99]|uniref:hypothetical protein n=1 Tax=Actinomadura sp. RB99 TaxID=2691577 RepID=UPI001687980F|nr:hypothetical protein [Actinomadura sp. RB99]MBD2900824.1 hypothetical protein [Actinomadura sp. RB99]